MPPHEVDRLLVEGELVVRDDGTEAREWPSQRIIASRFKVAPSLVAAFSKQHRCGERKAAFQSGMLFERIPEPAPVASVEPLAREVAPVSDATSERKRRPGRPRKADAPLIFYDELDRLLVLGEVKVLESGATTTVYPSYRTLAGRYGVATSVIADYAKSHNCVRRREEAQNRLVHRTEEKVIEKRAEATAVGKDRVVRMIDDYLLGFEKALEDGRVRFDNPTDVNTFARLREFIMGGADSRSESHGVITLESLQLRHAQMLRAQRDETPEMTGMIDVRPVSGNETERVRLGPPGHAPVETEQHPIVGANETEHEAVIGYAGSKEVSELVALAHELAHAQGVSADDAGLVARLLRAAERVARHVASNACADVGAREADAEEDER